MVLIYVCMDIVISKDIPTPLTNKILVVSECIPPNDLYHLVWSKAKVVPSRFLMVSLCCTEDCAPEGKKKEKLFACF